MQTLATSAPSCPHPSCATDDWKPVHEQILTIGRGLASHERELCWWLARAVQVGVHQACGFASLHEYTDRFVGLNRRQTEERLRVGRTLSRLPAMDEAFGGGDITWSKVRELSRIATPDTERDWLTWSQGRTSRQVEHAVATRRKGDRPTDPGDDSKLKHRLSFEASAETIAVFRALEQTVKRDLGPSADDDSVLLEIARRGLGGPAEGQASYQIAVTRCDRCGTEGIDAAGRYHPITRDVSDMARCDAQLLGHVDAGPHVGDGEQRPHVGDGEQRPHVGDGEQRPHVGDGKQRPQMSASRQRARQTIPPRIRRQVLRRHGSRCAVPGCNNHRFLDLHHSEPLEDGGTHDPEKLLPLCGAHHRATHRFQLVIEGTASGGFQFFHADGTAYGNAIDPRELAAATEVAGRLHDMGMTLRRSHALAGLAKSHVTDPTDAEALLEEALRQTHLPDD